MSDGPMAAGPRPDPMPAPVGRAAGEANEEAA